MLILKSLRTTPQKRTQSIPPLIKTLRSRIQDLHLQRLTKCGNKSKQEIVYYSDNYKTEAAKDKCDQSSSYVLEWTQKYSIDNLISPQWKANRSWFSPEERDNNKIDQHLMVAPVNRMLLKPNKSNAEIGIKNTKTTRQKINHTTADFRYNQENDQVFDVKVCKDNIKDNTKKKDCSRVRNRRLKNYENGEETEVKLCSSQTQHEK